MSKTYTQLNVFKDKLSRFIVRFKHKRWVIDNATYEGFGDPAYRDAFVHNQLLSKGFDLKKPIHIYQGITEQVRLFEQ